MATPQGNLGWIAVADEAVAYGTIGASPVYQHGISSTMGFRASHATPRRLGLAQGITQRGTSYADGEIVLALSHETNDLAVLYDVGGNDSTGTYTFGANTAPDEGSVSLFIDHGGVEYDYVGCKPTFYQWDIVPDAAATLTVGFVGQSVVKYVGAPRSPTLPPLTEIVMPSDIRQLVVNSNSLEFKRATVRFECPKTSTERAAIGLAAIAEPVASGNYVITGSIDLELDDTANNDTITVIDDLFTDGDQATIAFGSDISLATCYMTGEPPAQSEGLQLFTLNFMSPTLTVVTA